jgi:tetratricopeptide (TPR) repeat protein
MQLITLILAVLLSPNAPATAPARMAEKPSAAGRTALQEIGKLIDSGQMRPAHARLKEEVAVHGESYETYFLEARILFGEQRFRESLKVLEHSFALNKSDARIYLLSGMNWVVLERLDLARPFFEEASRLAPKDPTMQYHLGRYYYTAQRFSLAERAFRLAVELDPASARSYDNLGLALEAQHKDDEALASYGRAIELTEQQELKSEWPFLNLAKFLLEKGQPAEALDLAERALQRNPKSAEVLYVQGKALQKLGKNIESVEALRRSIQADATFAESHYLLGRIYLKQGRRNEAQNELDTFQRLRKNEKKAGAMASTMGR